MSGRTRAERIAASPTVVGAITTLIVIVAVFLAYNASNGLPFVPVYRVSAEMPNASRLTRNNEVRIGGIRVGVVESIETTQNKQTGEAAAKLNLKLDRTVKPLPATTEVRVRYKSSFGLKYLELIRRPGPDLAEGGTLPVTNAAPQTEFDAIANTFDTATRENIRTNLENFGLAFAGRGASLNQAIANLNPLFKNLKPVAEKLVAPSTRLERFFPELADAARIVAPVAGQNSELFTNMAVTFGALSADPQALRDTITTGVPTLETGIRTLPIMRPFLANFAELSRLLRPGVRQLRLALPTLNDALRIGTPVLRRSVAYNRQLQDVFSALERLIVSPDTLISLTRLTDTFQQAAPTAAFLKPYQTVCNYWNYWFTFLPEHISQRETLNSAGTSQRVELVNTPLGTQGLGPPTIPFNGFVPVGQTGGLGGYAGQQASAYAGIESFPDVGMFEPRTLGIAHGNPYGPALDANGNPDCQSGQTGNVLGNEPIRFPDGTRAQANDSAAAVVSNLRGNRGRTGLFYERNGTRTFDHQFPSP